MSTQPANPHQPIPEVGRLRCAADGCDYALHFPSTFRPELGYDGFHRLHSSQYDPGRAPDIAIDWVISASCSVCPDGIGEVEASDDGEGVWCQECGTTWSIHGTGGERAEDPDVEEARD